MVYSDIAVSADGFAAGPNQREEAPLGDIPEDWLHAWMFETYDENKAEVDGIVDSGATIMGRNMFGPVRGPWEGDWKGWWGDNPPYHGPVFVLTHYPRASITMEGGTTYHFVTDGIHAALKLATEAANGKDIRLAGGVAAIRQYLQAGLIDQMHLAIAPIMLGSGESLLSGIDTLKLGYVLTEHVQTAKATHIVLTKRK